MTKSKQIKTAELDNQIGFQLRLAQLAVFTDLIEGLKAYDLRPVDLSALLLIEAHPGLRQHVIADRLKIARPNIVSLVDSLARRDLVEREVDTQDRRANQLRLTPAGAEILVLAKRAQDEHRERLLKSLEGIDLDILMQGLQRLADIGKTGKGA